MLIPAYSRSEVWNFLNFKISEEISLNWIPILIQPTFPW
jgi:hypothetical protein